MRYQIRASRLYSHIPFILISATLLAATTVRAGLTLEMNLVRYSYQGNRYYYFSPNLGTNGNAPSVPFGTYYVTSPGYPTNGATAFYEFTSGGFNQTSGGSGGFNNFDDSDPNASFIKSLTNGQWSIWVTNSVVTNVYHFNVTANISSNNFPDVVITDPSYGAVNVTNQPNFTWQGPTNYDDVLIYEYADSAFLSADTTNWPSPRVLYQGLNSVTVHYDSYPTNLVSSSTPVDSLSHPISSWVSTAHFQDYFTSDFTVGAADASGTTHSLVAHYPFDATNGAALAAAVDTSGNGFDMSFGGGFGSQGGVSLSSDSAAGIGVVQFHNGDGNSAGYLGWSDPTPAPLLSTLAGSFSISCWIKTSQSYAGDSDPAYYGAGIVSADVGGLYNDVIPLALTGSKIGFNTGGDSEDITLNSSAPVNDGNYHHVVVTRNQATGQKMIYIDGALDSFSSGTTNLLDAPQKLTIGALADAGNPDPNDGSYANGFEGFLDDLQIYSGVLSSNDVATLFANPGSTVPDGGGLDFNAALNTSNLVWTTGGDAIWFVESTNTHDSVLAAQSGDIDDDQDSWLETTVMGPGTLSFWWNVSSEDGFDYLTFDLDGNDQDSISGEPGWQQDTFHLDPGSHTLRWHYSKDSSDSEGSDAGFLDEVSFVPDAPPTNTAPVITVNPFSQTNYPGYEVALYAAATSNIPITWSWYKIGNASPIPNATNSLYVPTNSGTAGVAGNYFAIATNIVGSATTSVATVTFQNAALPPDWSRAFKSPSDNNNNLTEEYYLASLADSVGNLYTAGSFSGTNTIGSNTFVAAGGSYESLIVKQTATGSALWAAAMTNNGSGTSQAEAVAPAPGDGLYVIGNFNGTNWLGTNQIVESNGGGIYLTRFDASGNILWVRTITSATNFVFTGYHNVVADPAGNVTVSGLIWGLTTFSSTNGATVTNLFAPGQLGALAQYDANGKLRWAEIPGSWVLDMSYSAGRIYGTMFTPETNFTGLTITTDRRWTLAAINFTNGQAIWLRGVGAPQEAGNPLGVVDDFPIVSVSGTNLTLIGTAFGSNASFGPYTVSWNADAGQYFARYDTNGTPYVATSFGSPTTLTWATVLDSSGNTYLAGDFDTYSRFGNDIIAAPHKDSIGNGYWSDAFLAKFDRNGIPLWSRPATAQYNLVNFRDLALVGDGIWGCGVCKSPAFFGTNTVFSAVTCIGSPFCDLTYHFSGVLGKITDSAAPGPVTLLSPTNSGANFQFQFLSQSGLTHSVQYRTNLVTGSNWQTYSNVIGDGTLKTIPIPYSVFSPSRQGFVRVSTQ